MASRRNRPEHADSPPTGDATRTPAAASPAREAATRPTRARKRNRRRPLAPRVTRAQAARIATLQLQVAFLQQYAAIGVVTTAAKLVGIDRARHYEWLDEPDKYPDYEARFKAAHEEAADRCETEMMRRGVVGWDEPVYGPLPPRLEQVGERVVRVSQGHGIIGTTKRFSDRLLELALKARRPEKFRERHEITGKDGAALMPSQDLTKLTAVELADLADSLGALLRGKGGT